MTRLLRTILISTILAWPIASIAAPPIWDADFGAVTGLESDDGDMNMALGFMFPFDGVMYDSVLIGTNGGIELGNGGDYAMGFITYDAWYIDYFEDYFTATGDPGMYVFGSDLDNGNGVGTIWYKTDGATAVITWDAIPSHEDSSVPIFTFQLMLASDGTITFGYDGMTGSGDLTVDLGEGIVVGVTNGMGDEPPDSSDLSAPVNADVNSATVYEVWCYDEDMVVDGGCYDQTGMSSDNNGFDLDQTNVIFTPNGTGGFDVSTDAAPPPPDPEPMAGEVLGKYGGCTIGIADGTIDPTLPLLVLISFVAILTRRKREA